jgi:hypothetical protein
MKRSLRFRGPSLILLVTVHILVFIAGLVAPSFLRHGAPFITPFAPAEQIQAFFAQSPQATRVANLFLFGAAVPFAIFTATIVSRLRFMGVRAAGTNITLVGGLIASIALFLSGMSGWILSLPEVISSAPLVKAIYYISFLSGGVWYAIGFGLLAAGVSVTSHFMRLIPRWVVVLGMLVAITGELSWFSLIEFPANYFIPITRYLGFIWMIAAAVTLVRKRNTSEIAQPIAA